MSNYYETLWVDKTANKDEIKKAYRKKAMQYHPDKNKWDATAESKFKEVNEAYQVLSDAGKRKQYDTFGSAGAGSNPFWGAGRWWNPFGWSGMGWFEDMFSGFGGGSTTSGSHIDLGDLFGGMGGWWHRQQRPAEPVSLDFEKVYEVPIFDMILGCKIEVRGVYGQTAKLTIPAGTLSWSKFRVKEYGKSEGTKKWSLIVIAKAKMPKNMSDIDKNMLETIRDNVGY